MLNQPNNIKGGKSMTEKYRSILYLVENTERENEGPKLTFKLRYTGDVVSDTSVVRTVEVLNL